MQDRPREEGIQPEAVPPRPRGLPSEPRREVAEGRTFHAEFSISVEDAMAIYDYALSVSFARNPKPQKASWKVSLICGGIALIWVAFSVAARQGLIPAWINTFLPRLGWMILGAFLGLLTLVFYWGRTTRATARRSFENDRELFVTRRYTLTPEALHYAIGAHSGKVLWEGIVDVTKTNDYLFIIYSPGILYTVPRHAFAGRNEFEAFVEAAQRYFQESGSGRKTEPMIGTAMREL